MPRVPALVVALFLLASGCRAGLPVAKPIAPTAFGARQIDWGAIPAPADNPVTQAKVELGFRLWFEPRLSGNDKMTCATCHSHVRGYSNAQPNAAGITGARGDRNVPTILVSGQGPLFWDGRSPSLEDQALGPIQNPIEMDARLDDVVRKLNAHPYYPRKFQEAFGRPIDAPGIAHALASFERALQPGRNAFDRHLAGEPDALTPAQRRGLDLFRSPRARCVACHQGADLTDRGFHNVGVGIDMATGTPRDPGRAKVSGREADTGAFKTPTLRGIAASAPYMHDGSLATLADVVEHYDRGGTPHKYQDPRVGPLGLQAGEKADLVAFLEATAAPDNLKELGRLPGIRNPQARQDDFVMPDLGGGGLGGR